MSSDICEVLLVLVDKYGRNIPAMPYRQETGAIKNLMQDWSSKPMPPISKRCLPGYWVSTLRSANEQFEQIMLIRSDAISEAAMGAAK